MRSAINSCASHNLTTSFLLLLFYAITGLVMSVEQTAWTDLSMVDPDRWGPTTNMNVSECMMWPPNLMSITMDLPFYLTRIVTYHQKYFVILCTQEVFFVPNVAREGVSSWVTLSNREFWNTRKRLNGDNVKNLIMQKPVSVLTSFDIFVSQEANILYIKWILAVLSSIRPNSILNKVTEEFHSAKLTQNCCTFEQTWLIAIFFGYTKLASKMQPVFHSWCWDWRVTSIHGR